jgi:hypothetical protein
MEDIKVGMIVYHRTSGDKWRIEKMKGENFCVASCGNTRSTYHEQSFPVGAFTTERPAKAVFNSPLSANKLKRVRERAKPKDHVAALLLEVESHLPDWDKDTKIIQVVILLGKKIDAILPMIKSLDGGRRRMWLGNQVRAALKKQLFTIDKLSEVIQG